MYRVSWICTLAMWFILGAGDAHAQVQPPNVVLIMTDDLGYGDLGSYGSPDLRSPNIDSLARDGMRLTDFYANGVLCSPTRAGLMTGRYQQRYAIDSALGGAAMTNAGTISDVGLPVTGQSLPQLLSDVGYATGLVGKWHLGYLPRFDPNAHGFDYFFGFKAGYTDYYQHTDGRGDADLWENEQQVAVDGYMTDLITAHTVDFIERSAHGPFFVDVAYNAHTGRISLPTRRQWPATTRRTCSRTPNPRTRAPSTWRWSSGWIRA